MCFWRIWTCLPRQSQALILFIISKKKLKILFLQLLGWFFFAVLMQMTTIGAKITEQQQKNKKKPPQTFDIFSSKIMNLLKTVIYVLFFTCGYQGQRAPGLPYLSQGWLRTLQLQGFPSAVFVSRFLKCYQKWSFSFLTELGMALHVSLVC